ncbi:SDR family oxidoreductase [Gracilibacillus caseinilyticus]|uniref:SDR family oxidoreductase n=1 Tax=Gracilibacillus caseinilyticus TaxID=2932256 RepID=A0ABY4ETI6_9BACI|nr:SDR family oxidoreductase [Gracilibacillus caseinilyticus]UOQ47518.1 SDR family oxidoreductase [Gracilibacillus caseinilyticus]
MNRLQDKHVLITGASSGIGETLAHHLAAKRAIPILVARTESKLVQTVNEIEQRYHIKAYYYAVDITDRQQWKETLDEMLMEIGELDAVINNAGLGFFERFDQLDWSEIEKMIQLNLKSLFFTTYHLLPHLLKNKPAHIVNIGSQAGKVPTPKSSIYSATKASVISFSNALRMELEDKVSVTSVNIGPVKTAFFDQADPDGTYQKSIQSIMLDPNDVAAKITTALFTKKREINLPVWMNAGGKLYQTFPRLMEKLLKPAFNKK